MKKKSLKAVGTVLAVCLCATACGSTASTTTEDNTVNSETKEASTEQASVVQSQETAEVSQDAKEASVDNFTVTYLDDGTVMLSAYVIKIESDVFSKCPELKEIFIPESVTEIDPYAFYMSENVTIYTPAGSYAESFAIENNIPYVNQ